MFDPFKQNDLFSLEEFEALIPLCGKEKHFAEEIAGRGRELLSHLVPFAELPRFAVQGDMADCNLFVTPEGELGLFDFNNCGDNAPFLDAVMHAVYISRLMEYGKPADEKISETMFVRFWRGYSSVRPLSAKEEGAVNEFTRLICAFWKFDVTFREDSLTALLRAGEHEKAALRLARMAQKLNGDNLFA